MKRLDSNVLWSGKWTFRIDKVVLDNGHHMNLALIDHPGSVVIVPMIENRVILVRQFRPVIERTILELPAGTFDADEDAETAAQRELREETGYRAEKLTLLSSMLPSPGTTNEVMRLYLATGLSHAPLPQDEDEVIEIEEAPLEQLVKQAQQGKLEDAKTIIGVLQTAAYLGMA